MPLQRAQEHLREELQEVVHAERADDGQQQHHLLLLLLLLHQQMVMLLHALEQEKAPDYHLQTLQLQATPHLDWQLQQQLQQKLEETKAQGDACWRHRQSFLLSLFLKQPGLIQQMYSTNPLHCYSLMLQLPLPLLLRHHRPTMQQQS